MKINDLDETIIGKKCTMVNKKGIYIIMDYIKNIHDKNNVKIYNPITNETFWVPFNLVNLLKEEEKKDETN